MSSCLDNLSIIVAMAKNNAIGKNNQLLWHLPNDLKRFKALTLGKPVVMGRKTYESIIQSLGKPLPGRDNLVITSDTQYISKNNHSADNVFFFTDINNLLNYLQEKYSADKEIMIIGGGEIYKQFLNLSSKIYLTLVDTALDGDVFFPEINKNQWHEITSKTSLNYKDDKHNYDYSFIDYEKTEC